jgi:cell division protein FtsI (penicillin-binding protein 3)
VTKIAFDMGSESLRQGLVDFGFGSKSGLDLPGESKGQLQPLPWNQHLLSNISFGQGIAVTPMQIANAYATIANGGMLNAPYIVQSIRDPDSGELTESKVKNIHRVLSEDVAQSMRMMLMAVTAPGGTGVNANVDGFLVGGKTGTAQKVDPNGRGYLNGAYISSFAGFIPAGEPKFVIYIAVDHPKKTSYYGAAVAAPVFSRVASYAVRMEGLAPMMLTEKNLLPGPAFKSTESSHSNRNHGKKKDSIKNVQWRDTRAPASIVETPAAIQPRFLTSAELLAATEVNALTTIPDFKNQSVREVLRRLSGQDIEVHFVGSGVVSQTEPAAGSDLGGNKKMTIYLK